MSRSLNLDRDSVEEKEFERRTRGEKVVSFHQAATRVRYRWVATVPNMAPALHRIGDARIFPSSRPLLLLLLLLLPFDMIRLVLAAALHFFASIFFIIYSRVFQMTAHSYVVANLTPFSNERGNAEARSFLQLAMIGDKKITSHTHRQTDRDGVRSNCLYDPNLHTSRNARPASVVVPLPTGSIYLRRSGNPTRSYVYLHGFRTARPHADVFHPLRYRHFHENEASHITHTSEIPQQLWRLRFGSRFTDCIRLSLLSCGIFRRRVCARPSGLEAISFLAVFLKAKWIKRPWTNFPSRQISACFVLQVSDNNNNNREPN